MFGGGIAVLLRGLVSTAELVFTTVWIFAGAARSMGSTPVSFSS